MTNQAAQQTVKNHAYRIHDALYDAHKATSDAMKDLDARSDDWNELSRYMRAIGLLMHRVYDRYNLGMTDDLDRG